MTKYSLCHDTTPEEQKRESQILHNKRKVDDPQSYDLPPEQIAKPDNKPASEIALADCPECDEVTGPAIFDQEIPSNMYRKRIKRKVAEPSKWKRNMKKNLRNAGEEYIEKVVNERKVQPPCDNCRNKCSDKVSDADRQNTFKRFLQFGDKA